MRNYLLPTAVTVFLWILTLLAGLPLSPFLSVKEVTMDVPRVTHATVSQNQGFLFLQTPVLSLRIASGDSTVSQQQLSHIQMIIKRVQNELGSLPVQGAEITVYGSPAAYQQAVSAAFPANEVQLAASETTGFTTGTHIFVPLYKYPDESEDSIDPDDAYLANTIMHELTHVAMNQTGLSALLPNWMQEGTAWAQGMRAGNAIDPKIGITMSQKLFIQLEEANIQNHVYSLDVDDGDNLLEKNPTYNVEFIDYLAVEILIEQKGPKVFTMFLRNVKQHGLESSFLTEYGMHLSTFITWFDQQLLPDIGDKT